MIKLLRTIKFLWHKRSAAILGAAFWIFLLSLGTLTSCTKKPGLVGNKLLPDSALSSKFTDTVSIRVYSRPVDTTITDHQSLVFVGSKKDPVFGTTTAGFYAQFIQSLTHQRFGTNPQPDSLILQMSIDSVFGDTTQPMTLHVYEINENIYNDSTYYSTSTASVDPTDYADYTFLPHTNNTIIFAPGDTLRKVIRINLSKLSNTLAEKLMQTDTTVLDSNAYFKQYFKGLYITASPVTSGGALAAFYPISAYTALTLYYHNDSTDSLQVNYGISDSCALFNHYEHDFSTGSPEFVKQVVQKDTTLGQQKFYIQGLGGLEAVLKFPNLKNFARLGKTVSINEAKLILPGFESSPAFGEPASLSLLKIASDSSFSILNDQLEGGSYFGGAYNSTTNSYTFRLTHYIQSLIQDTTQQNLGLILYVPGSAITPQRFIFNGPKPVSDTLSRAKLELLYTTVPTK